jgi:hypothetical protein
MRAWVVQVAFLGVGLALDATPRARAAPAVAVAVADTPSAAPAIPPAPAVTNPAAPGPGTLPRAGVFGLGFNLDLIELGAIQAFGRGGSSSGALLGIGPEIDLGPHAALRVPLQLGLAGDVETVDTAGARSRAFWEIVVAPGWIYRFRRDSDQRWIPYVGGALAMGGFQFGRQLLGLEPSRPGISQAFIRIGVAPEALAGVLYAPRRWFAWRLAASYTYLFVAHTSAHALGETIAARFSF